MRLTLSPHDQRPDLFGSTSVPAGPAWQGITRQGDDVAATLPDSNHDIITQFAREEGDTGSPEVQVALLTKRIAHLTEHLKDHPADHDSRRGLRMLVGRRRRLLDYLQEQDIERYRSLIGELQLRG